MSSLIPERPIVISPLLAATIGLHEAILLQTLSEISHFQQGQQQKGATWYTLDLQQLVQLLPFWDQETIQQVMKALQDKGIIVLEGAYFTMEALDGPPNSAQAPAPKQNTYAQPAPHTQTAYTQPISSPKSATPAPSKARSSTLPSSRKGGSYGATPLPANWQPDEDLLSLLQLNHSIPKAFALEQCEDFVLYWRDRGQASHSWASKFRQHVLKEWRHHQSRQTTTQSESSLEQHWQPSIDAVEILCRTGINQAFVEDAIPEFVLYWRERGAASSTWNSKFIAHIRRQWAKYNQTLKLDYEPRPIESHWQPNGDVYDILRLANIDIAFAKQLVPEFVLFWRDTQEIHRSWNTKFLQHVKYQWATRHHMGQQHAGHAIADRSNHPKGTEVFQQLTDRSWAEGIVEGI